jgi:hypothetical protein
MVVTNSCLDKALEAILPDLSSVNDIPLREAYLIGGCGLLKHGVFDTRGTDDVDLYFPDAHILPLYSNKFYESGYTGVNYPLPSGSPLKVVELFSLLENEPVENHIISNSTEICSNDGFSIKLAPLEALIGNKICSYSRTPERIKDLDDISSALDFKRGDCLFERNLETLLDSAGLRGKYKDMFVERNCRSGAAIHSFAL